MGSEVLEWIGKTRELQGYEKFNEIQRYETFGL